MAIDKIKKLEKQLTKLDNKPNTGASGRKKVDILNELAHALLTSDPVKTESYARQALALAQKSKYKSGKARSYHNIGNSYKMRDNIKAAEKCHSKAFRISKEIGDNEGIFFYYSAMALIYYEKGEFDCALQYSMKSLEIAKENSDKTNTAHSHTLIGVALRQQGNEDKALEHFFKALEIYEDVGDMERVAHCYGNIGIVYLDQEDYTNAKVSLAKALKIFKRDKHNVLLAIGYLNLGTCYFKEKDYPHALEYFSKSNTISKETGQKSVTASSYGNIGGIYFDQHKYKRALAHFREAIKVFEEIENKYMVAMTLIQVGFAYTKLRNHKLALKNLKKGIHTAQEIKAKQLEIDGYEGLFTLYETRSDYKKALAYYRKYISLRDGLFNAEKNKQIVDMRTKYEAEQKEKEADLYRLKNVKLRGEIKRRKRAEKLLEEHSDRLEELVAERTSKLKKEVTERRSVEQTLLSSQKQLRSLAREISLIEEKQRRKFATFLHDDINQALALVTFKLRSIQEMIPSKNVKKELTEVNTIIDKTAERTRTLAFEISPPILYELGLEPALEWLVRQFAEQYMIKPTFKDDELPKPLDDNARVFLFQSVRELLANIAKHAQAQRVNVSVSGDGSLIRIAVQDDGVGFNPKSMDKKIRNNEGFGLFNVRERLRHLHGQMEIQSKRGKGTTVTLVAPLKHPTRKRARKRV